MEFLKYLPAREDVTNKLIAAANPEKNQQNKKKKKNQIFRFNFEIIC